MDKYQPKHNLKPSITNETIFVPDYIFFTKAKYGDKYQKLIVKSEI